MIAIDFQAGQHGNFLEFVCNKFLAGVSCGDNPFDNHGASHNKVYYAPRVFISGHYFQQNPPMPPTAERVISIQIDADDLLPLSCISLLRAGNLGIDANFLEIDTYHKLNNIYYQSTLDNLIKSFFQGHLQRSYQAVKDATWPDISDVQSFYQLPQWIQDECTVMHGVRPMVLDSTNPHCPRSVLREFFKIGFAQPEQSGFVTAQRSMLYNESLEVLRFPFKVLYNKPRFLDEIAHVADWASMTLSDRDRLIDLHGEFLSRQPYANIKTITDEIYHNIMSDKSVDLRGLNLLQESYLDARFEQTFGRAAPTDWEAWFENGAQVRRYFSV